MWFGTTLVLLSAAGYALLPIFLKIAYEEADFLPTELLMWRFLLATAITWGIVISRGEAKYVRQLTRQQIIKLLSIGVLFSMAALCAFLALDRIPATTYTVLLYSYPATVAILSMTLYREQLSILKWMAIGLTFAGCILTVGGKIEGGDPIGIVLVLGNATLYALYLVFSAHSKIKVPAFLFSALSMCGMVIGIAPVAVLGGFSAPDSMLGWGVLLALVVFSTLVPMIAILEGMRHIGAPTAAILSTIEPVLTVILAALLLKEEITLLQYAGGALIFASVLMLQVPLQRTLTLFRPRQTKTLKP
jgi:drug/metabolite transporter (DMT)-like permease